MAARLPDQFIHPKPRQLKDLVIGEQVYIPSAHVLVSESYETFLLDGAEFRLEPTKVYSVRVSRDADGFHILLPAQFVAEDLMDDALIKQFIPVQTISVDGAGATPV